MSAVATQTGLDITEMLAVIRERLSQMRRERAHSRQISREEFRLAKLELALREIQEQTCA